MEPGGDRARQSSMTTGSRPALAVLLVALALLAACGSTGAQEAQSSTVLRSPAPSQLANPSAPPAVVATPSPSERPGTPSPSPLAAPVSAGPQAACGGQTFPGRALTAPTGAETGDAPHAAALRAFLATPNVDAEFLPDSGWRLANEAVGRALYLADDPAPPPPDERPSFVYVALEEGAETRLVDGTLLGAEGWGIEGWGGCVPQRVVRDGSAADWVPAGTPAPTSSTLDVLVHEVECSGSRDITGLIRPPEVIETDDEVVVTFTVEPLPPADGYECAGNPSTPYTVQLDAPLGERTLLDGHFVPPAPPPTDG